MTSGPLDNLNPSLGDSRCSLRRLSIDDASLDYVSWLNDPVVTQYLESRFSSHTLDTIRAYIADICRPGSDELLLGIFAENGSRHIGNIKLGPINFQHKHADVGIIIGDKSFWGKGYASSALLNVTEYATQVLGLESLKAGCYEENIGSYKAFLKAGWKIAGRLPNHWIKSSHKRCDEIILCYAIKHEISIPSDGGIALIGSGRLQRNIAIHLRSIGFQVVVVYAPRHHDPDEASKLLELGCTVLISENINSDREAIEILCKHNRLCLCFGPAWIFGQQLLSIFQGRIFNFNGIPLPDYLGGAHYTWQILNGSLLGGAYIQQITPDIDRGPVVSFHRHALPPEIRLPCDYDSHNEKLFFEFMLQFINKHIVQRTPIVECEEQPDWDYLSYFPRLLTQRCSWIDWSWTGPEIEAFCNAFDDPYAGSRSLLNGNVVILRSVYLETSASFHPFCSGLIVRASPDSLFVAVRNGILRVESFYQEADDGHLSHFSPRLGDRFFTPDHLLEEAKRRINFSANGVVE